MTSGLALLAAAAFPSPLPTFVVDVQHVGHIDLSDSYWTVAAAVASLLVAIGTGSLAFYTWKLAIETKASLAISKAALDAERVARTDEERRHQQRYAPLLWMAVEKRVILAARRNSDDLFSVVHSSLSSQQQSGGKGG